jgi:hypothetical protein
VPKRTPAEPKPFVLCFEAHATNGQVWALKTGKNWIHAREVSVLVPTLTVYRGRNAPQPRAYLVGNGVVTRYGGNLVITG